MIRTLLHIEEEIEEDAADALACALCHLNTRLFQKRLAE
jgi:Holliday junction resolvasome RuvABC endonuclease subunit